MLASHAMNPVPDVEEAAEMPSTLNHATSTLTKQQFPACSVAKPLLRVNGFSGSSNGSFFGNLREAVYSKSQTSSGGYANGFPEISFMHIFMEGQEQAAVKQGRRQCCHTDSRSHFNKNDTEGNLSS